MGTKRKRNSIGNVNKKAKTSWEIESILSHFPRDGIRGEGTLIYKVEWILPAGRIRDWGEVEDWVIESQMDCPEFLDEYWENYEKLKGEGNPPKLIEPTEEVAEKQRLYAEQTATGRKRKSAVKNKSASKWKGPELGVTRRSRRLTQGNQDDVTEGEVEDNMPNTVSDKETENASTRSEDDSNVGRTAENSREGETNGKESTLNLENLDLEKLTSEQVIALVTVKNPPENHPSLVLIKRFLDDARKELPNVIESLKPIHILFFCPEKQADSVTTRYLTIFENRPNAVPSHICEYVPCDIITAKAPELVVDVETRYYSEQDQG